MANDSRERDLVLAPNEFAFISDQTKGNINVYVGPYKTSLANTDQPVFFNSDTKRFERCLLEQATKVFATAPEGWYVVMKNPARDNEQPKTGTVNNLSLLEVGHKVNLPGPRSFAMWPGQMAKVVKGHNLRSNQYLVVRIYDEDSARKNWAAAVVKLQGGVAEAGDEAETPRGLAADDLTIGQQLIIRGTEVSFYIPPTGVEVVADAFGDYVRDAVTLERLEYCVLLDETGNKRFIQGPAVVFPEPTEVFVEHDGTRKFRAIELSERSGLYVKVIAPYTETGETHTVGQELFITGNEQMIYFPRPEHAVVKYGEREVHYAVAIPAGEGRYVLDRQSGQIRLERGPAMFLPDPRKEVIVRRVLDPGQVALWFPGNQEAMAVNQALRETLGGRPQMEVVAEQFQAQEALGMAQSAPGAAPMRRERASSARVGDDFSRKQQFTPPRTVTLDTKYEGAVTIGIWTGYAVQVVSKSGQRRVVVGPHTVLLEYDESLESMTLSTGTPKTEERLYKTAYLRVLYNKVSDEVEAETADLCQVRVRLSYRVNFEGEPSKWFNVENFVKFLTDHMRSVIRNAVKRVGVQQFYAQSIGLIRDTVLGVPDEAGKRTGRVFTENGMRIYDVEVLDVVLGDDTIEQMLTHAQHAVVEQTLALAAEERKRTYLERTETLKREVLEVVSATRALELGLKANEVEQRLKVELAELAARRANQEQALAQRQAEQDALKDIETVELARREAKGKLDQALAQTALAQELERLRAEAETTAQKAGAVSPDLIAALQAFGDRALVEKVAQSMAPLAILGGTSVAEVVSNLLRGTPLERVTALVKAAGAAAPKAE